MFRKIKKCINNITTILNHVLRIESYINLINQKLDSIETEMSVLRNGFIIKKRNDKDIELNNFKEWMISLVNKNVLVMEDGLIKGLGEIKSFGIMVTSHYDPIKKDIVVTHKKYIAIKNISESEIKAINITDKTEITLQTEKADE